jgi:nitrogen regulatory protein P-II 1
MKKIEAIIRPERLDAVREVLEDMHYPGMTLTDVRGHGKQKGITRMWRGREYKVDFLPKLKIEIVALDDDMPRITEAIAQHGRTGEIGDGKIFILPVDDAVRVRTGEEGEGVI